MVRCLIWALCCDKICLRAFFPPPLFLPVTLMHRLSSSIFLSFSVYRFFLSLVFFFFFFPWVWYLPLSAQRREKTENAEVKEKKKKKKKKDRQRWCQQRDGADTLREEWIIETASKGKCLDLMVGLSAYSEVGTRCQATLQAVEGVPLQWDGNNQSP